MPHRDFDAARRGIDIEREPVTFRLGGEEFTVVPTPSLGDVFDLADAPDVDPGAYDPAQPLHAHLLRVLTGFIRRLVPPEDRNRFDDVIYRIPSTEGAVIIMCAHWIAEQVSGHPTLPPTDSSDGRPATGMDGSEFADGSAGSTTPPSSPPTED